MEKRDEEREELQKTIDVHAQTIEQLKSAMIKANLI